MSSEKNIPSSKKVVGKKEFSLADFKKKIGGEDIPQKPLKWLKFSDVLQKAIGIPSIPINYVTLVRSFSNAGKSTMICEACVAAQKEGILPVIIDTENNLGRKRLEKMGFDWDNDFFIYIDNDYLLENYGKKQDKSRTDAAIEDMGACINDLLDMQERDELPYDLLFAIDSFGTLDCIKSVNAADKGSSDNNMWNAGAFEKTFKYLLNNRIPSSRKINKKYNNTMICTQKIYTVSSGGGANTLTVKHKGGEAAFYGARLIIHLGGTMSHGTKKIKAISKGREVIFGIEAKISVIKNQIDGDLGGIALEGSIISTPHGYIGAEKNEIEKYKKENISFFREVLGEDIGAEDIKMEFVESDDISDIDE